MVKVIGFIINWIAKAHTIGDVQYVGRIQIEMEYNPWDGIPMSNTENMIDYARKEANHTECTALNFDEQQKCKHYRKASHHHRCMWLVFDFMCQWHDFKEPEGI